MATSGDSNTRPVRRIETISKRSTACEQPSPIEMQREDFGDNESIEEPATGPPSTARAGETVGDIKRRAEQLISNERIEKDAAIGFIKIFHDLETLLLHAQHAKERENERLRNDLEVSKLTHKQAEMIDSLATDVRQLTIKVEATEERLRRAEANLEQVAGALNALSAKKK